nr:hypothetical protein OG409_35905 [Streptomyces sp. NBC_00974]
MPAAEGARTYVLQLAAAGRVGFSALAATPAVLSKAVVDIAEFTREFLAVATQMAFAVPARP